MNEVGDFKKSEFRYRSPRRQNCRGGVWAAMNGDVETARWAAQKLLARPTGLHIEKFRSLPMFRHMARWAGKEAEALRLAGVPERCRLRRSARRFGW